MSIVKAGLADGIVGGAFDLAAATTIYPATYGIPPLRIVQSIASGVLGARAYEGGLQTALLGAGLHFFIAIVAGFVLAMAMARVAALRRSVPALALDTLQTWNAAFLSRHYLMFTLVGLLTIAIAYAGWGVHFGLPGYRIGCYRPLAEGPAIMEAGPVKPAA